MAFFGLIGNDRQMAATTYAGKESASQRRQRKEAERSARRRQRHHRAAIEADRDGWRWADAERERQEGRGGRRGWFS
ncbi:hypothetical protein GA0115233_1008109 [Streptomyces sp. DI166]|uniref:hypothetical protein n=1 Tax=Streptomyces sp. DI166 TaxID=1839783 RepID=UPI0007F3B250|nr:hypothetical protein [Streptomyces sp. DI166]SBT89336.1 hypothetical protein GA0115233_1008109 [Streptomyces sp. DI166]